MLLVIGASIGVGAEGKSPDFRKVYWGMSKDNVRKIETESSIKTNDDNELVCGVSINGDHCILTYRFDSKNKLYEAEYAFMCTETYSEEFNKLKKMLSEKYGSPVNMTNNGILSWCYKNTGIELRTQSIRQFIYITYRNTNNGL